MNARKILTAVLIAGALLSWGVVAAPPVQQPAAGPGQKVTSPGRGPVVVENCQIFWKDERIISSKIPGKIHRRLVEEGDVVEKDQVLAMLDDREAKLMYAEQKIMGDSELAQLIQRAKYKEYLARRDTAEKLISSRTISLEEYRLSLVNVEVNDYMSKQEVEKHQIEKIKAERTEVFLKDHVITSPMKGVIAKCFKREKESVASGDLQMFYIVATDVLWVEGNVPVRYLYQVRVGQRVEVTLVTELEGITTEANSESSGPPMVFEGRIVFKDPNVDFTRGTFRIRAEVKNSNDLLQAGLQATMKIFLPEDQGASGGKKN